MTQSFWYALRRARYWFRLRNENGLTARDKALARKRAHLWLKLAKDLKRTEHYAQAHKLTH